MRAVMFREGFGERLREIQIYVIRLYVA